MNAPTCPIYERVMKMSPVEITETFTRELSCDPTVLTAICSELSVRRPETSSHSHQEALASMLVDLLTERVMFEVMMVPTGKKDFKLHLYPFGIDRPMFSFSMQCLGTNPTMTACLLCMIRDGREREADKLFNVRQSAPDRSKIVYKDFLYNELFSVYFFRAPLFLHFIQVFISGLSVYLGCRYPDLEVALRSTVLLDRTIKDVDSRLAQMIDPNLSQTCRIVSTLRNKEKTFENVANLFSAEITEYIKSNVPPIKD